MGTKIAIPLVDDTGAKIRVQGVWGSFGFGQVYHGEVSESDRLVVAIRNAILGTNLKKSDQGLLFSFLYHVGTSPSHDTQRVLDYAINLPESVQYVCRIGMFDRTTAGAIQLLAFAANVASFGLLLPVAFEMEGTTANWVSAEAIGFSLDIAAEKRLSKQLNQKFGAPGTSVSREQFDPQALFYLLRLGKIFNTIESIEAAQSNRFALKASVENQIFNYFLINSRQIEGLKLSGAAEATSAVVALTAIAIGWSQNPDGNGLLVAIEGRIDLLHDQDRQVELRATLSELRKNISGEANELGRQLNRSLSSATSGEATEFVAGPVKLVFRLLGSVSGGLGKAVSGDKSNAFSAISQGFHKAAEAADSTPDAVSHLLNAGASAESWTREVINHYWPTDLFAGSQAAASETSDANTTN